MSYLNTNYSWVREFKFQRGDNHKTAKMGCGLIKIFSRTTGLILTRLDTNHP
jgi:hypothetical protein